MAVEPTCAEQDSGGGRRSRIHVGRARRRLGSRTAGVRGSHPRRWRHGRKPPIELGGASRGPAYPAPGRAGAQKLRIAYSEPSRPPIPILADHPFRFSPTTVPKSADQTPLGLRLCGGARGCQGSPSAPNSSQTRRLATLTAPALRQGWEAPRGRKKTVVEYRRNGGRAPSESVVKHRRNRWSDTSEYASWPSGRRSWPCGC